MKSLLLDTNILVYCKDSRSEFHSWVMSILEDGRLKSEVRGQRSEVSGQWSVVKMSLDSVKTEELLNFNFI